MLRIFNFIFDVFILALSVELPLMAQNELQIFSIQCVFFIAL
jgi:hypothetical protein